MDFTTMQNDFTIQGMELLHPYLDISIVLNLKHVSHSDDTNILEPNKWNTQINQWTANALWLSNLRW